MWIGLVSCLPALQDVTLTLTRPLMRDELGRLLEALARCPGLTALDLSAGQKRIMNVADDFEDFDLNWWRFPDAAAFAKLRSLTKLALCFSEEDGYFLADIVGALVPLTGLAELSICSPHQRSHQPAVAPAALGQLKGLRSLALRRFSPCILEAGCLNLPNLMSLEFEGCYFEEEAQVLPGVTALQCLTRFELSGFQGTCFFDPGLVQLSQLKLLVLSQMLHGKEWRFVDFSLGLVEVPADMGLLSSSLLHLDVSVFILPHFPLALTHLVALKHLNARWNDFAELPAGITALSRLTELMLGRCPGNVSKPCRLEPLDVRALGDLSGFPALRELEFCYCEVMLCPSLLGAVLHASLAVLCFDIAHPAPECAPVVLQLSRELRRLRRGSVVTCAYSNEFDSYDRYCAEQAAQGRAACQDFEADLNAYGQ